MAAYDELNIGSFESGIPLRNRIISILKVENSGPTPVSILSVTTIDSTHIKINFNQPLINNFSLNYKDNYTFTPTLTTYASIPEAVTNPTYTIITVSEMKQDQLYSVTVQELAGI